MSTDDQLRAHSDRVVDTLLDSLRRNDMRAFADQWAPDGVMEFPFAPPGYRVLNGRDDVWDYVKDYTATKQRPLALPKVLRVPVCALSCR